LLIYEAHGICAYIFTECAPPKVDNQIFRHFAAVTKTTTMGSQLVTPTTLTNGHGKKLNTVCDSAMQLIFS